MKIIGLMPCRNEDWILGLSARAALMWCDELVVLNHASADASAAICDDLSQDYRDRFHYMHDPDPTWREMAHRQKLLEGARVRGATHIAMIDADEVPTPTALLHMRDWVESTPPGRILTAPMISLRDDIDTVMTTGLWANASVSLTFKDEPALHWQAQGREGYDFHHRHPMGRAFSAYWPNYPGFATDGSDVGVMHLQFVSLRRLLAKQYAYQLIERLRWPDRKPVDAVREMYSRTVREAIAAKVHTKPRGWLWKPYEHILRFLDIDSEPWQVEECRRIIRENPGIERGLDDFGLGLGVARLD